MRAGRPWCGHWPLARTGADGVGRALGYPWMGWPWAQDRLETAVGGCANAASSKDAREGARDVNTRDEDARNGGARDRDGEGTEVQPPGGPHWLGAHSLAPPGLGLHGLIPHCLDAHGLGARDLEAHGLGAHGLVLSGIGLVVPSSSTPTCGCAA